MRQIVSEQKFFTQMFHSKPVMVEQGGGGGGGGG